MNFNLGSLLESGNLEKLKQSLNETLAQNKETSKDSLIKAEEINKVIDHISSKMKELECVTKNLESIEKDLNHFTTQTHETKEDVVAAMRTVSQAAKDVQDCLQTIHEIKEGISLAMSILSGLLMFLPIPGLHLLTGN